MDHWILYCPNQEARVQMIRTVCLHKPLCQICWGRPPLVSRFLTHLESGQGLTTLRITKMLVKSSCWWNVRKLFSFYIYDNLLNLIDSIDCWNDTPRYFTTNQEPVATASHHPFISAISSLHKSIITGMCVLISFWCLHDRKNPYIGPLKVYNYNLFQSPSTMTQASQGITQLSSHIGSSVNSLLNSSTPQLTSQVPSLMSPAMANTSQPFDVGLILNYLYLSKNCLCYYFSYVRHVKRV